MIYLPRFIVTVSQACIIPSVHSGGFGVCVPKGRRHAWQRGGGMHDRGAYVVVGGSEFRGHSCMVGGMHDERGHTW